MHTTQIHHGSRNSWAPALLVLILVAAPLLAAAPAEAQRGYGAGHPGFGHPGFGRGHAGHGFSGWSGHGFFGRHGSFFDGSLFGGGFHDARFGFDRGFRFGRFDRSFFFAGPSRFDRHFGVDRHRYGFVPLVYGAYPWAQGPARGPENDVYSRAAMKPGPYIEFGGRWVRNLAYERSLAEAKAEGAQAEDADAEQADAEEADAE